MKFQIFTIGDFRNVFKFHAYYGGDFRNVFKFHAYYGNKRLFLTTTKLVQCLSDVATTNVCKVDTSNRNHIERSRWMEWLITGLRQKKYPLIWIHYESGLFMIFSCIWKQCMVLKYLLVKDYIYLSLFFTFEQLGVIVAEHALTLPEEPITECGTYSVDVTVGTGIYSVSCWLRIWQM